jgi:predicted DsbA family dithiol-disulfide isomerase
MTSTIFVFSDVVCPWCYLGKRRLEHALHELSLHDSIKLQWLPFELNPDMPPEGMPRAEYRARKFGPERSAELDARMRALGEQEGVQFAFDRMQRTPNTRRAHMLIAHATQAGRGDEVVEALFRAYFEEARDVGDPEVLSEIGTDAGLHREEVHAALNSADLRDQVTGLENRAAAMRIGGVPFFILEGGHAVSGAQSGEDWKGLLRQFASTADAEAIA